MAYEVDILAVGEDTKSGDAIAIRFGDFLTNPASQRVVVVDGGFKPSGDLLVKRIKEQYGTDYVDLVISTHPDADHINGLHVVLDELRIGELWMHTPWNISEGVKKIAEDRDFDPIGSSGKFKKSLQAAYDLEQLANQKGIPIVEPFEGTTKFGVITVLGPSTDYYFELASSFDENAGISLGSILQKAKNTITELWNKDELVDPEENAVSARNNSSVITLFELGKNFLFVGDAGIPALTRSLAYTTSLQYDLASNVHYHHIPHHGSKRNLGPTLLNNIVGPILPEGQTTLKVAMISAAPDSKDHPSPRVTNALIRRGVQVARTCGEHHCYHSDDVPIRPNWGPITFADFVTSFEEE